MDNSIKEHQNLIKMINRICKACLSQFESIEWIDDSD